MAMGVGQGPTPAEIHYREEIHQDSPVARDAAIAIALSHLDEAIDRQYAATEKLIESISPILRASEPGALASNPETDVALANRLNDFTARINQTTENLLSTQRRVAL